MNSFYVMLHLLAESDPSAIVVGAVIVGVILFAFVVVNPLIERVRPTTIVGRLRRFLGGGAAREVRTHEKSFPGYDLASVNRALLSFLDERCDRHEAVGSGVAAFNFLNFITGELPAYSKNQKPQPATYQRLPVDVDDEESFVSNCLYLCSVRPAGAGGGPPQRVAVLLSTGQAQPDFDEEMEVKSAPVASINLSIACRAKGIADDFFHEMEARRQRLSVFRGKVIEPNVSAGGIRTIAFRKIRPVREDDLVLPESVKALVRGSLVGFYEHRAVLQALGVELKRGILFHSPPGTGKTSTSLYLAGLLPNFTVCFVAGRRLLYPREVCAMARYLQPAMLVFEDIDLIAQERDFNGLATVLGELMNQIDGCEPTDQVLFIMNTNSLDRLEQAVRNRPGRVDQIIQIPLPDAAAREALLRKFAHGMTLPADLAGTVRATDGETPATLKEIVKRAAVYAVTRATTRQPAGAPLTTGDVRVDESDLLLAREQINTLRDRTRTDVVL